MEFVDEIDRKTEFENVLKEVSDEFIILNNKPNYKDIDEVVYGVYLNKGTDKEHKFVIFSSISIYDNKFREYGSDAIRLLRWNNGRPVGISVRVNRTKNWMKNLTKKLHNFKFNNVFEDAYKAHSKTGE